ncbi:hypothetical protein [Mycobacterium sp.]|uniref:hypothetical protein n=1 Tax=Mycobacterium sp. TaxID=1785 RepID=UPI0031E0D59F
MEFSLRLRIGVVAVASASVIAVALGAAPPLQDIRVPVVELASFAGPLEDLPSPFSAVISPAGADPVADAAVSPGPDGLLDPSGPLAFDAVLDPGAPLSSIDDTLTSVITALANIAILAGVATFGGLATPFSLLGGELTFVGAAITSLGGVFTPIGTAVGGLAELPAGIAELIETSGATITQDLVTPIYDFLLKLVSPDSGLDSGAASTFNADGVIGLPDSALAASPADLTQALDASVVLDVSRLLPDLLTLF